MTVYKFLEKFYQDSTKVDVFIVENKWETEGGQLLDSYLTVEEAKEKFGNRYLLKWSAISIDTLDVIEMILCVSSTEI